MAITNVYAPAIATLEDVIVETPTIRTFVLRPAEPMPFRAGQFVQLTLPGVGEAPFTPSSSPHEPERIEITVLRTGRVTEALHEVEPGTELGLRGPFGKGYPLGKFEGKEVLVVGGGVGLAPLRSLILAMLADMSPYKRLSIQYGARTPEELLYRSSFDAWREHEGVDLAETIDVPATGWEGRVGLVTSLLTDDLDIDIPNSYAVSCGPAIMLKFVTQRLLELGYPPAQIYLSMNRRMSCGIGKCGRCNIGPYYLCKDGPDMCYEKIKDYPNVF
ncbi:MAG: FAD/NAD(P)-binding protein [Candidatus Brocadiia bacterium]